MVYIILASGFEECEALIPFDLLRRANISACLVSAASSSDVECKHGIVFKCDMMLGDVKIKCDDCVVLPGGIPGVPNLDTAKGFDSLLNDAVSENAYIAAICAAPTLLGKRGLLKNKNAVCYPGMENELCGAKIRNSAVVRDGRIITSMAAGTSFEFGAEIIRVLAGDKAAEDVLRSVCYD